MEEPSVLDYVKAKLQFWKKSDLRLPSLEITEEEGEPDWVEAIQSAGEEIAPRPLEPRKPFYAGVPWLVLLGLFLALVAQLLVEPPARRAVPAAALYLGCAFCLGLALWRGQIRLSEGAPEEQRPDRPVTAWVVSVIGLTLGLLLLEVGVKVEVQSNFQVVIRAGLVGVTILTGLGAALWGLITFTQPGKIPAHTISLNAMQILFVVVLALLILLTFLSFGEGVFTGTGLTLWLVLIAFTVIALGRFSPRAWLDRLRARFSTPLVLRVDWFVLLVIVVLGVTAFFRLANLEGLPREMFSDHAEKLYDVNDVLNGQYKVFFERNTGREMFQFYWTALMALVFNTGISFMSLKIGTVIVGLITLYYIYRIGDEVGGKWVALYALFFAAVAYWPNIISRIGLRFPLYPFCVAPVLFYLLRGLRRQERNDFVWAGIWLGIGLHGYTASRIVPLVILLAFGLFLLHRQSRGVRLNALVWLAVVAMIAFVVILPLFRFALDHPDLVNYRTLTRMGTAEQPLPGPIMQIFFQNLWNALTMFFWSNGDVWVHSIPYRPALTVTDAALFFSGLVLLITRYIRRPHWRDLFLPLSIPVLLLPSILSLAFPNENPNLNRTAGAYVVVFVILALGLDAILRSVWSRVGGRRGLAYAGALGGFLAVISLGANYHLFFEKYQTDYNTSAWNTSELGAVMQGFSRLVGTPQTTWVVGYPYWVDTRLVGINAGYPTVNPEIFPDSLPQTYADPRPKLYLLNVADAQSLDLLRVQYPAGRFWLHKSPVEGKDFIVFMVPAEADTMP